MSPLLALFKPMLLQLLRSSVPFTADMLLQFCVFLPRASRLLTAADFLRSSALRSRLLWPDVSKHQRLKIFSDRFSLPSTALEPLLSPLPPPVLDL